MSPNARLHGKTGGLPHSEGATLQKPQTPQMSKCQRAARAATIIIMKMCLCSACERWGAHLLDAN